MRCAPVIPVAAAFAAGAWVSLVVLHPLPAAWLGVIGLVAAVLARAGSGVVVASCLAGFLVAQLHDFGRRDCAAVWPRGDRAAVLRLHDGPGAGGSTTASVVHDRAGCGGEVRLRLDPGTARAGETIVAVGVVLGRGTFRVDHVRRLPRPVSLRFRLRRAIRTRIRSLYGPRAPLVDAMVLGRRDEVDPLLRQQFVAAGIAHLLAISGLHVGILAAWVALGLSRFVRPPRAWGVGAAVTWFYVGLLGFPASATRAAVFVTVTAVSQLRQRTPGIGAVVAVAGLALLVADPRAATAVGAWLSVAAVLGTAAGHRLVEGAAGRKEGRAGAVLRLGAASAGATVLTAPITAFSFGQVAPIGIVTNLVAVPLAGLAVPGLFLSLVFGKTLAAGSGLALAGIEWLSGVAARVPGGHLEGPPGAGFASAWVLVLLAGAGVAWRYPLLTVTVRRAAALAAAASWISLAGALPLPRPHRLVVVALDVGQGDAIVVRTPRGRAVLIDGGPRAVGFDAGARVVAPALARLGIRDLEAVLVSHADADHLGGVPAVLERVPSGLVVEPGQPVGSALYQEMHDLVAEDGVRWMAGRAGDTLRLDSVTVAFLHPTSAWMAQRAVPNENSLVLHLSYGGFDALFTGDVGFPAESAFVPALGPMEVLKVGHHGSAGSTGAALLDALTPQVAVISVGRRNRYGHPAPSVLARLRARGVEVFRTDAGGAVTIETDGSYFAVHQGSLTLLERLLCRVRISSPSSGSSSSRNGCSRRRPVTSRTSSTTSPSRGRSSRGRSDGQA